MVNPDNQILDLKLGQVTPLLQQQQTEAVEGMEKDGFAVLFAGMLGLVDAAHDVTIPSTPERGAASEEIPLLLFEEVNVKTSPQENGGSGTFGAQITNTANAGGDDWQFLQIQPLVVSDKEPLPVTESISLPGFTPELRQSGVDKTLSAHSAKARVSGEQVSAAFPSQPFEAGPEAYEILRWSLRGGVLQATVATKGDKSGLYTISVPVSQLKGGISAVQVVLSNQDVQATFPDEKVKLEYYLSKLNPKEIEIVCSDKPVDSKLHTDSTGGRIFADDGSSIGTVRSRFLEKVRQVILPKSAGKSQAVEGGSNAVSRATADDLPTLKVPADPPAGQLQTSLRVTPSGGNQGQFYNEFSPENLGVSSDLNESEKRFQESEIFSVVEKATSDVQVEHRRVRVQPVRFILPDNLTTTLRPNGRAVTLWVEPKHLGPAKLSLSMYNDKLRARLVVNDFQARAAVEGSLDRLLQQLSRAGVAVDHIEVIVGGDGARDGRFERHSQRNHLSNQVGRGNLTDVLNPEQQAAAIAPVSRLTSYMRATGINVLA